MNYANFLLVYVCIVIAMAVVVMILCYLNVFRNCFESEFGTNELRLYFAALIANMINSLPLGEARLKLFSAEMRSSLFQLFANWCDMYGVLRSQIEPGTGCVKYTHTCKCSYALLLILPLIQT